MLARMLGIYIFKSPDGSVNYRIVEGGFLAELFIRIDLLEGILRGKVNPQNPGGRIIVPN